MKIQRLDGTRNLTTILRWQTDSRAVWNTNLLETANGRRTALYSAHVTQFGIACRQVGNCMRKRKRLCRQQYTEQREVYRIVYCAALDSHDDASLTGIPGNRKRQL